MSEYADFLIVGAGISGLSIHYRFAEKGIRSVVVDLPHSNYSTRIAAGLLNPITGRYLSLSWRAEAFFPEAQQFYSALEKRLDASFYKPMDVYRIFPQGGQGEQNKWLSKIQEEPFSSMCKFSQAVPSGFEATLGSLKINGGGRIDTHSLLNASHADLLKRKDLLEESFAPELLDPAAISYKGVSYAGIVFCEGSGVTSNPWFSHLPFSPNKGEILQIRSSELSQEAVVVGGVFCMPIGDEQFLVGASYDHHELSHAVTEIKREWIRKRFENMHNVNYEIVDQRWGIRPAVKDRRPLMGQHPNWPGLYLLNGMGSKGLSMAPLLSKELCQYILEDEPIHPEADLARYQ